MRRENKNKNTVNHIKTDAISRLSLALARITSNKDSKTGIEVWSPATAKRPEKHNLNPQVIYTRKVSSFLACKKRQLMPLISSRSYPVMSTKSSLTNTAQNRTQHTKSDGGGEARGKTAKQKTKKRKKREKDKRTKNNQRKSKKENSQPECTRGASGRPPSNLSTCRYFLLFSTDWLNFSKPQDTSRINTNRGIQ